MSTAALCGMAGVLTGITGLVEVTKCDIDRTGEALDSTSYATLGWKEKKLGLRGCTGTCETLDVPFPKVGPYSLSVATKSGACTVAGNVWVNKVSPDIDVAGIRKAQISFTFTGSYTVTGSGTAGTGGTPTLSPDSN
jgi:hypothetical protein